MDPNEYNVEEREEGVVGLEEAEEVDVPDEDGAYDLDDEEDEPVDDHYAYLLAH